MTASRRILRFRVPCAAAIAAGAAAALLASLAPAGDARAESPGRLVAKGNRSYERRAYDAAIEFYDKASVKAPESAVIAFNRGAAYFRKGEYAKARECWNEAAAASRDLRFEAKAWYNLGNTAFAEGGRQADSDLKKALALYEESVRFYLTALERDPKLADAAHNLEVARLTIKDILDRLQRQQELSKEQQEEMRKLIERLIANMGREQDAIKQSVALADRRDRTSKAWTDGLEKAKKDQEGIRGETGSMREKMNDLFGGAPPEPVQQASAHLDTSMTEQRKALGKLAEVKPRDASLDQGSALEQMKKALEKLTEQQNQPQGGQGEDQQKQQGEDQQQEQGQQGQEDQDRQQESRDNQKDAGQREQQMKQAVRDANARDIIDREKKDREERDLAARRGAKPVGKDW